MGDETDAEGNKGGSKKERSGIAVVFTTREGDENDGEENTSDNIQPPLDLEDDTKKPRKHVTRRPISTNEAIKYHFERDMLSLMPRIKLLYFPDGVSGPGLEYLYKSD